MSVMSLRRIAILLLMAARIVQSQTEDKTPMFEVASVKPSGEHSIRDSGGGPGSSDPGQYHFNSSTLQDLIAIAYNVEYFQISSKAPLDRQRFDLVAKLAEGATKQQFRLMMQSLLAERFHLKLHIQSKEFLAYELVVAEGGPKFKETVVENAPSPEGAARPRTTRDDCFPDVPPNRPVLQANNYMRAGFLQVCLKSQQEPISVLARMLRSPDDLPMVDKTGLTGKYDFTLEYTKELRNVSPGGEAQPPSAPSLFLALQQQLGLQLVEKKIPFDVLIIDSVDKLPTEN
jgi:uncharacterized protein (TIGR03435 family)